jgi:pSer/pThr/pTyr-binding forkhead associated (FHA) protein
MSDPVQLRVLIAATARQTPWMAGPLVQIGRADANSEHAPEVDLEPEGGRLAGVSRRHAQIARTETGYTLEDLGSANGTWLNRRKLAPHEPVPLVDGDEIRCGSLLLRVALGRPEHPPMQRPRPMPRR